MMSSSYGCYVGTILLVLLLTVTGPSTNTALAFAPSTNSNSNSNHSAARTTPPPKSSSSIEGENGGARRSFLASVLSTTATVAATLGGHPRSASAAKPKKRYVLDDATGDYVQEIDDGDWQKEWKSRYDQMQTMSKSEIFEAARGAGNLDSKDLANESDASKKRRAFSGCRDKATRAKIQNISEQSCSKRVLEGEIDFVLEVL